MTNYLRKLPSKVVQQAGLHLVAAEALLRGLTTRPYTEGRLTGLLINGHRVEVHTALDEWPLTGPKLQPEADAAVFVRRGEHPGDHEYFIADRDEVLTALKTDMDAFLARHDGVRPRTPGSNQQTLHRRVAEPWRDQWGVLAEKD